MAKTIKQRLEEQRAFQRLIEDYFKKTGVDMGQHDLTKKQVNDFENWVKTKSK